ncbi:MAG: hypothetical protein I8H71_00305 [Xanthomonadaceae bacterium]|nr:hypothetical protein [Xanthomonadaceae bacterium]MBH2008114.1 hypothetical protein [Xanthomonadaceae bacterium]
MIVNKKCLNCNHVASQDISVQACPACQAIYSKVEAALTQPEPSFAPSRPVPQVRQKPAGEFIDTLRADSNYPNFRVLVKLATWFFYLVAITLALSAILSSDVAGPMRIGAILGAVVMVVFVTAAKEASLMLADLSDAAVYSAVNGNRHG